MLSDTIAVCLGQRVLRYKIDAYKEFCVLCKNFYFDKGITMSAISSYGSYANYGAVRQGAVLSSSARLQQQNNSVTYTSSRQTQSSGVYCATCNSGSAAAKTSSPTSTYCPTCNKNTSTYNSAALNTAARSGSAVNAGGRLISSAACPTCGTAYARNR
jgi:hypothetical protein